MAQGIKSVQFDGKGNYVVAGDAIIIAVWGLANTTTHRTTRWRDFLADRGWQNVPRIWD